MQDEICDFCDPPDGERRDVLLKKQPLKVQIEGNMPQEIYALVMSHIQKLEGVFPPWLEILVLNSLGISQSRNFNQVRCSLKPLFSSLPGRP